MHPFSSNDYRKRVLAAVERRGGVTEFDAFERYDIPLDEATTLTDAEVAQRIDAVWAFWQKHRDHPKYRVLVERLVAEHAQSSAALLTSGSRVAAAHRARTQRESRENERFALLDNAIERLVERYGGIPVSKRDGLDDIGTMSGLTAAEVATRLRRVRVINDDTDAGDPTPPLSDQRLTQIAVLLDEFSQRRGGPPVHTLLAVLDLSTDDINDHAHIVIGHAALRDRARELPAGPMRALIDELLIHIEEIVLAPPPLPQAYRRAVLDAVDTRLRPHIRAAILVEDRLHPNDHQYLLEQARDLGLGTTDARHLIASVAAEFGGSVPPEPARRDRPPTPSGDWQRSLRSARQALRKGIPEHARRRIAQARELAGDDVGAHRQIDALDHEITRMLVGTHDSTAADESTRPASVSGSGAPAEKPDLPPITDVVVRGDLVTFGWPAGITEAVVVIRSDAPPESPSDPAAVIKKITTTSYDISGGHLIPGSIARPGHVAIAACRRTPSGALEVAPQFGPQARAHF